jgi:hypothetical protein
MAVYKNYFGYYLMIVIIVIIVTELLYVYASHFTKTITIKNLDYVGGKKYGKNIVTDLDNKVYSVSNSLFYGFFSSTELYTNLKINGTYIIKGYGYRVDFLNMYPNIISATLVNS